MDEVSETFMLQVAALKISPKLPKMTMHPSQAAQIAALQYDEAPTKIPSRYADYANIFSFDLAIELPKNTGINKYAIKLQADKQPPYRPI